MGLRFLFLPLVLVGAFAVIVMVEKPSWESNKSFKKEVAELKVALDEIKGKNGFAQQAIKEYQDISGEKTLIINALPEEKEGNVLMAEFFDKAKKTGAFLKSIKVGDGSDLDTGILSKKSDAKDAKAKSVAKNSSDKNDVIASAFNSQEGIDNPYGLKVAKNSLELMGSYEEVRNFILEVEKMNRFLNIEILEIKKSIDSSSVSPTAEAGGEGAAPNKEVLQVFLEVNTYWMKSRVEEALGVVNEKSPGTEGQSPVGAFSGDLVLKSLLSGEFSSEIITVFQSSITKDIFQFNNEGSQGGIGKGNLF